ncbi:Ger(x)C family spore germination C-terminal domain-containing protein [Alicyclobacillus fastidiosus]|uniref:Ger(X)C family spore germination C-terminal domain-containing protein n=1 Tax=Alicyclobacillus fastidiosus TaxID=392011 RepID=A0ABY6ZHX5_9BACL|nr:Ger(x)C family spore germination C-terminal domain-containing protein [Alicyclobacillus fastidiosus]WAH42474.1 Ger(x)C family spore germination C-terminal domain-containing protein [Alicyclobacillus fastidiosus]
MIRKFPFTKYFRDYSDTLLAAGKQQKLLSTYETSLRNLLFDAMSDAASGTLPVIDVGSDSNSMASNSQDQSKTSSSFSLNGTALFNRKLQLVGYLQNEQSLLYLWGVNRLQHITLSESADSSGNLISLQMSHLHSRISVTSHKGHMIAQITLSGTGRIIENHTKLSPSKLRDIVVIQQRLNQNVSNRMQHLIIKTQEQYQTDIFKFGEEIHRTYPLEWQHIKTNWPLEFPKLKIEVSTRLTVLHGGEVKTGDIFAG